MIPKGSFDIRRLLQQDVHSMLDIIRGVRREYGLEARVEKLLEPADYSLFDLYRRRRSAYFIALEAGEVVGGADFKTCELQRMYLRPDGRGRGIGLALLQSCIHAAESFGFERCYAETISAMTGAIAFYRRNGFSRLSAPLGQTGHGHNDCWMLLDALSLR